MTAALVKKKGSSSTYINREVFPYKAAKLRGGHLFLTIGGHLHAPAKYELKFTAPGLDDFTHKLNPNTEPPVLIHKRLSQPVRRTR